jgi:hypothetical protein
MIRTQMMSGISLKSAIENAKVQVTSLQGIKQRIIDKVKSFKQELLSAQTKAQADGGVAEEKRKTDVKTARKQWSTGIRNSLDTIKEQVNTTALLELITNYEKQVDTNDADEQLLTLRTAIETKFKELVDSIKTSIQTTQEEKVAAQAALVKQQSVTVDLVADLKQTKDTCEKSKEAAAIEVKNITDQISKVNEELKRLLETDAAPAAAAAAPAAPAVAPAAPAAKETAPVAVEEVTVGEQADIEMKTATDARNTDQGNPSLRARALTALPPPGQRVAEQFDQDLGSDGTLRGGGRKRRTKRRKSKRRKSRRSKRRKSRTKRRKSRRTRRRKSRTRRKGKH